jgi:ATP-binding cassette subfamily B protein
MNFNNIRNDISNISEAARLVYEADKKLFTGRLIMIGVQSVLPLAYLYLLKLLVDSISHHQGSTYGMWTYAVFFCGIFVLIQISSLLTELTDELLSQKLTDHISSALHKQSANLDLSFYDNAQYHDTFHRAQQEAGYRPMLVVKNLSGIIQSALSLAGIIAVLFTLSWLIIVILVVAAIPSLFIRLYKSKIMYQWQRSNTNLFRKTHYYSDLLTNRRHAKELRIFNIAEHFQERFNALRNEIVKNITNILFQRFRLSLGTVLVEGAGLLIIVVLLYENVNSGLLTIGTFVMFFEAFRRGQGFMQGLVSNLSGLYNNKLFIGNLFEFMKLCPEISNDPEPVPFPNPIKQGIIFENVSFHYPGSEKKVIDNMYLEAIPGTVTNNKGKNGAGKTTLIKLLCRLYDCDEGKITIDGTDIRRFDLTELRKNISVIFQDFSQYDLTVHENISLGNVSDMHNHFGIRQAAQDSHAEEIIEGLPLGYDTQLGKQFENGEELSLGQWQRIALGRTLFKDAPIMILDEPTSWLDIETQEKFYTNLEKIKKNRIVILISHNETQTKI